MDATYITDVFSKEVDVIYLNFSDPWPKNRHENRRLSSKVFLERYDSLFKGNKEIIMKTDNRKLFEFSIESIANFGYKLKNVCLDLHNSELDFVNVETEFEEKYGVNSPIYRLEAYK